MRSTLKNTLRPSKYSLKIFRLCHDASIVVIFGIFCNNVYIINSNLGDVNSRINITASHTISTDLNSAIPLNMFFA